MLDGRLAEALLLGGTGHPGPRHIVEQLSPLHEVVNVDNSPEVVVIGVVVRTEELPVSDIRLVVNEEPIVDDGVTGV